MSKMPNLAATLKEEIRRLARKEIKASISPAKRIAAAHRREITNLKRLLKLQEQKIAKLMTGRKVEVSEGGEEGDPLEGLRFSARSVRAQRRRLKLSADEFGKLLDVSAQTIYHWEQGKARPRRAQFVRLVELRGLGRREAADRLAETPEETSDEE
jgi:succinate dehydrogenase flavin-adding protein (antitoxin of CptAB toxin-antitoxin module)